MIETLQSIRDLLAAGDRDALEAVLGQSSDDYSAWINRRHNNKWDNDDKTSKGPSAGEMLMTGLMGGILSKRLRGNQNGEEDK